LADKATERRRLGRELRKAREAAGVTQSDAGTALSCGQAKINKIESTEVAVDLDELDTLLEVYHVPAGKRIEIRALAGRCRRERRRAGLPTPSHEFRHFSDLEMDAIEIRCLHSERIPDPLQSEQYMLYQSNSHAKTTEDIIGLMRRREARAQLLAAESPPRCRVILSESSLQRMPGGQRPELVVDQVVHLLELIRRYDRLELHMLTYQAPVVFVSIDFALAQFDGSEDDFAYLEHPGGGTLIKAGAKLSKLTKHWDELRSAALNRDDSVTFLEQVVADAHRKWQSRDDN
jgi:transcriptional regulator with XRE-family HTH domain